jgi:hypothetical protein
LQVVAVARDEQAHWFAVEISGVDDAHPGGPSTPLQAGLVHVDGGAILLGDVDAVGALDPQRSEDGLADVEVDARKLPTLVQQTEFDVPVLKYTLRGWRDLDMAEAERRVAELRRWRTEHQGRDIGIQVIPHSTQWLLNRRLEQSPWRSGAVDTADGGVLIFETSVGDGTFPVVVDQTPDRETVKLTARIA